MTSIDIVIPCAGRVADLQRLLTSIHAHCEQALAACVSTITVTDDRPSTDLKISLATEFPRVNYVHGPARGPAANRNHGAGQGASEWILFLDDDCYVETDLVSAYASAVCSHADSGVFEGSIHPVGERPNGNHHAPLNVDGGQLWSCNMLIARSLFNRVGGFDQRFPFACMEDVDLRTRLLACGALAVFVRDAIVLHPWRSISEREVSRQIISHAVYAQKHPQFVHDWTLMHLLRAVRGRVRQYRLGQFSSIPWSKYRTVAYDCLAPLMVYMLIRFGPLRHRVSDRYRNRPLGNS